jgi:hypothetical protein
LRKSIFVVLSLFSSLTAACGALAPPSEFPSPSPSFFATATANALTAAQPTSAPSPAVVEDQATGIAPGPTNTSQATVTATQPPPTTPPTPIATLAALPTIAPTPNAVTSARCGNYTIAQQAGAGDQAFKTVSVTITDAQGQVAKKITAPEFEMVQALWCGDITGDGTPELVLSAYSGGAHCCFTYDIFSLAPNFPSVLHWEAGNGGINRFALLKGALPYQIIGSDDRFAYAFDLPFAASPFLPIVFDFRDGVYVNATRDFPDIVRADQTGVQDALKTCNQDEFCEKSIALHIYADAILLNEEAQTFAALKPQAQPSTYAWLTQHRAEIMQMMNK